MPLSITKIAYRSESPVTLRAWLERGAAVNGGPGHTLMTTRYLPTRHAEMVGGSLYWIFQHTIIGRSPIQRFEENGEGRYSILLEPTLIPVHARPKRAHQGWRYLEEKDAPIDLGEGEVDARSEMSPRMLGELTKLGLV
ncbi:MAG: DUF1489 domain-containing protein [Sphingorhabdus sp.]